MKGMDSPTMAVLQRGELEKTIAAQSKKLGASEQGGPMIQLQSEAEGLEDLRESLV
jgi:hypothetical protein